MSKRVLISLGVVLGLVTVVFPQALIVGPLAFVAFRIFVNPTRMPVLAAKIKTEQESTQAVSA